jgi:hypothetical protein
VGNSARDTGGGDASRKVAMRMDRNKLPKESPTDAYRLARRARQVLRWTWDFEHKQFVDAAGNGISRLEVEPLIVLFLKQEIDASPIWSPNGKHVAKIGVDIHPATVIAALKALSLAGRGAR